MEANYPYSIKNQRGASKKPLVGGFGCEELVLYGIRDTVATPRKSPRHRDGPDCDTSNCLGLPRPLGLPNSVRLGTNKHSVAISHHKDLCPNTENYQYLTQFPGPD